MLLGTHEMLLLDHQHFSNLQPVFATSHRNCNSTTENVLEVVCKAVLLLSSFVTNVVLPVSVGEAIIIIEFDFIFTSSSLKKYSVVAIFKVFHKMNITNKCD